MKRTTWMLAVFMIGASVMPVLAWDAPTDTQLATVLADHSQLNALVQGASPSQLASVLSRALAQVDASALSAEGKSQVSALLYTRGLLLSGESAPQMVSSLAGQVNPNVLPVLAASTAVAVGNTEGVVMDALINAAGAGTEAAAGVAVAAQDPASTLSGDSLALVQQLVIEMRGVAAPVIPPPATAPYNLVPPVVPRGEELPGEDIPQPPPVAETYSGQ